MMLFLCPSLSMAQTTKGVVKDNEGVPLRGASVTEKGTANGTISDFHGNYTLKVSSKTATLVYSFIGFTDKFVALKDGKTNVSISLEPATKILTEVVKIGYGTMKKKEVTGVVVRVGSESLSKIAISDVGSALQGKVAGVNV